MSEVKSELPFEKDAHAAVAIMDALYHGEFEAALKPESLTQFNDALTEIIHEKQSVGVGEFVVQFFLNEDPDRPVEPGHVPWLAVHYNFAVHETAYAIEATHALMPKDSRDLTSLEDIGNAPSISLGWGDIRADFDIHRQPHSGHGDSSK